jgi:hypothetical protein
VVPVADKQAQLVKFETFKSVQDNIDGFGVDVFEVSDFGDFNFLFFLGFGFVDSDQ